jgi:hypothetical protein
MQSDGYYVVYNDIVLEDTKPQYELSYCVYF